MKIARIISCELDETLRPTNRAFDIIPGLGAGFDIMRTIRCRFDVIDTLSQSSADFFSRA